MIRALKAFRYKGVLAITAVFALMAVILFIELTGVQVNYRARALDLMPEGTTKTKAEACEGLSRDTLLLWNSASADSVLAHEQFGVMLDDMKVGHDDVDLSVSPLPELDGYSSAIVLISNLSPFGDDIITFFDWVYGGGNAMFVLTLEKTPHSSVIEGKLGIIDSSPGYVQVDSIYISPDFMVGGGRQYTVPDGYDSARAFQLSEDNTTVYMSCEREGGVPLVWRTEYGDGTFVVNNFGICDKAYRGFYAASYSLLGDVGIYPVINGSVFYLDDFPSQIPDGNSEYIVRDYNTTIRDFYINIWWSDMMNLCDKYGIKYTGLAIECYDDAVDGTTDATPDTGTFLSFGNMLLRKGGEIGYHGYNHQPLCFDNCDYKGIYDYKTWQSYSAMKTAFDHLVDFCDELFPDVDMAVYVPPSNLLSNEGREFLGAEYPQIRTVSGIYFPDDQLDFSCIQEFNVDEKGVVDQPRIISGCSIDDFMFLAALSELNMHYVNSHFTHPDDSLDPERGAEKGWERLYSDFDDYLSWLAGSAVGLRNFTGTEMSAAIQRYVALTPETEITEEKMTLSIGGFLDDAQFFVRFNGKAPGRVEGGSLTPLAGSLYLLDANSAVVTVFFE